MLEEIFENVRSIHPLIHNITNYVTANDCANIVIACGAAPIMADDGMEVSEITSKCSGLAINMGTLNERTVKSMLIAGEKSNELRHPVILDPVGVGVSKFRMDTARKLLGKIKFSVIRGNISEIKTLKHLIDGSSVKLGGSNAVIAEDCADERTCERVVETGTIRTSVGVFETGTIRTSVGAFETGAIRASLGALETGDISESEVDLEAGEIRISGSVSKVEATTHSSGVDASAGDKITKDTLDANADFIKKFAKEIGSVIAVTGAVDIVTDGEKTFYIRNGHSMMGDVTGTGCQLSSLIAAFVSANPHEILEATVAAVCAMGLAGEIAHERLSYLDGNATYRNYIIDAIYNMTPTGLKEGARYEIQ